MARPRKDAEGGCARTRLIAAFWTLLEEQGAARDITAGEVSEAAGCNRGTFYYYFADMDALITAAVDEEVASDDIVVRALIGFFAGRDVAGLVEGAPVRQLRRIALAMRSGEMHVVERAARLAVQRAIAERLCVDGEQLAIDARFAVQFAVSGFLGFIAWAVFARVPASSLPQADRVYLKDVSRATIAAIARAQGITPQEVVRRLVRPQVREMAAVD